MVYKSGTDALRQLTLLRENEGHITRTPGKILIMPFGSYYFVEVTSKEGTKYVIEVLGEAAIELEREASHRKLEEELVIGSVKNNVMRSI
jgi:hypothetical protein